MDNVTGMSLGSRICSLNHHASLEMSTAQALAVHDLDAYLGSGSTAMASGAALTLLCLFCWFASLSAEVRSLIHFFESACKIPSQAKALLVVDCDGTPTLSQLSPAHMFFMAALALLRVSILIALA